MNGTKVILSIILVVALCLSWIVFGMEFGNQSAAYNECMKNASDSFEQGLYEQAVEFYKESLKYKNSEDTYVKIKEAYDTLYAEEHTAFIRNLYLEDMILAADAFPKHTEFWTKQIELHMEAMNYAKAYKTAKQAMQRGAEGDTLNKLYKMLLYMVKEDYGFFTDFKTALNGYISVCDGNSWQVIDEAGEDVTGRYAVVGLINDDGKGLYMNEIDTRLLDSYEITRGRYQIVIEDAGYYNESVDLVPVKTGGKWKYMHTDGTFLPGEFDVAGSFYDGEAVACVNGQWLLLDETGKTTVLNGFEDIKLDLYGCHLQNDIILGKTGQKYHLYDADLNMIGDFAADDIDICIDPDRIAFQKDGKWGFVNSKGKVVKEPEYADAKSFANGYAAVADGEGRWGFINEDFELVIDYQYLDAHYFTQAESCMVSITEGAYQMIHFMFD